MKVRKYLILIFIFMVLGLESLSAVSAFKIDKYVKEIYNNLNLRGKVSIDGLKKALIAYNNTLLKNPYLSKGLLTIIDYSKPSKTKRLFVIDLYSKKILIETLVAHGKNSGDRKPIDFSDYLGSEKSSLGAYIATNTYSGKHGKSLKLKGLEKDFNANAYKRGIVIHGADYVNATRAENRGTIGRSQGCPAVPYEIANSLINTIKDGSFVFIYADSNEYAKESSLLAKKKWIL